MGLADRIIRIAIAIIAGVLYFTNVIKGPAAIVFAIVGIIFLLTALINFCPLYKLFGITTCKRKI